jgi:hypothetical protein
MSQERLSYDQLLELARRQERRIDALLAENARLRSELDEVRRTAKRQAAPCPSHQFSLPGALVYTRPLRSRTPQKSPNRQ